MARFIGWRFTWPILLATLVGIGIAWWFLVRWLAGYPYPITLGPQIPLAVEALTLTMAWINMSGNAARIAALRLTEALPERTDRFKSRRVCGFAEGTMFKDDVEGPQ